MDVNVTEAGDEGEPEKTSCPALMSVAEIVLETFCVTAPNVNVCVLATLMAAFTVAVALTVAVSVVCAPATLGSASATQVTAFNNRLPKETPLARVISS